jgi:hypothetical protein
MQSSIRKEVWMLPDNINIAHSNILDSNDTSQAHEIAISDKLKFN